jgi:hypothetical protein
MLLSAVLSVNLFFETEKSTKPAPVTLSNAVFPLSLFEFEALDNS